MSSILFLLSTRLGRLSLCDCSEADADRELRVGGIGILHAQQISRKLSVLRRVSSCLGELAGMRAGAATRVGYAPVHDTTRRGRGGTLVGTLDDLPPA
jgi:hypothetical protein